MTEYEKLYTVDDIAKMTSLTSRTIRNYLKDGSLQGKKIGGQWRFTMKDIEGLFNHNGVAEEIKRNNRQDVQDFLDGVGPDFDGEFQVCTIADYYCGDAAAGKKMCDRLMTVINDPDGNFPMAKFHYDYIEKEKKARFVLFGTPDFIIRTLELMK